MTAEKREQINRIKNNTYVALTWGFLKWVVIAVIVGVIVGLAGTAFSIALGFATAYRTDNKLIIFAMPVAGVAIVFLYNVMKLSRDPGTNNIIKGARSEEAVSVMLAPLIFAATFLTHITGGSAGREGAPLQIGRSLAS